eukprot:757769-Prorocentrum_minimum.AAC.5
MKRSGAHALAQFCRSRDTLSRSGGLQRSSSDQKCQSGSLGLLHSQVLNRMSLPRIEIARE